MGNLSSSPFPKKQSVKPKRVVQPELGGDAKDAKDVVTTTVDLTDEESKLFLARIAALKQQIMQARTVTGGSNRNHRRL